MKSLPLRLFCGATLFLLVLLPARAEKQGISREQAEALVSGLKFQQGEVTLHVRNGLTANKGLAAQVGGDR